MTTQAAEEKTSAHSEKGLLVVMRTGRGEVTAGDDLEEEVGVAIVVVEVPDLVDGEQLRAGEASQSPGKGGVGVLGGELVEHVRGHGESGGEAVEDGVVEEVLHEAWSCRPRSVRRGRRWWRRGRRPARTAPR